MGKISDEIRNWCAFENDTECGGFVTKVSFDELSALADRIDAEMVELPRDRDGVPIHVDDTVYLEDGGKATVTRIELIQGEHGIDFSVCGKFFALGPEDFTHVLPDSWKRIAEDIQKRIGTGFIESSTLGEWADRIRKLAKEQTNE